MKSMKRIFALIVMLFVGVVAFAQTNLKIVTPLFQATDIPAEEVSVITDYFISKYAFAMRGKAEVVDRNSFDLLVAEHEFQTNDWASAEGRSQLEMLNATHLVKGQLSKFRKQIVVTIWLIDVKTAVVYATYENRITDVEELFDKMSDICKELASQINGSAANSVAEVKKETSKAEDAETLSKRNAELETEEEKKASEEKKSVRIYHIGDTGPGGGYVFKAYSNGGGREFVVMKSSAKYTYSDAVEFCNAYRGGGYSNWHLIDEDDARDISGNYLLLKNYIGKGDYWTSKPHNQWYGYVIDMDDATFWLKARNQKYPFVAVRAF